MTKRAQAEAPLPSGMVEVGPARAAARRARVLVRQTARLVRWACRDVLTASARRARTGAELDPPCPYLHYEARVRVQRADADVDPIFEAGKRRNVALAAPAFDGVVIPAGESLSFWRTLGRVNEAAGYVAGMELRGGCVVPAIGGGICLLSNALFTAAVYADWRILERHGHSLEAMPTPPGQLWGLDATVFWPHVDLVVAPRVTSRITMRLDGPDLVLRIFAAEPATHVVVLTLENERTRQTPDGPVHSGRIVRRRLDGIGRVVGAEVVATSRKRVIAPGHRKSCLDCGEPDCHTGKRARRLPRAEQRAPDWVSLV